MFYQIFLVVMLVFLTFFSFSGLYLTDVNKYDSKFYVFAKVSEPQYDDGPDLNDDNLIAEVILKGLKFPTSMAFIGSRDILVTEKNEGTVLRFINGTISGDPLLRFDVSSEGERGMLGVAVQNPDSTYQIYPYVYLFLTEKEDTTKASNEHDNKENDMEKYSYWNRVYRFEMINNKLENPLLLFEIPAEPGNIHNGGVIEIGHEGEIYVTVGDIQGTDLQKDNSPNGRGGILKIPRTIHSYPGTNKSLDPIYPNIRSLA